VLKEYDNQPLPSWPSQITLNTVVALLSTISRAALLEPVIQSVSQYKWIWFQKKRPLKDYAAWDEASRGPLGSLALVFTTRIEYVDRGIKIMKYTEIDANRLLSLLSALLLVSSLLTATITQATVTYSQRAKPVAAQGALMQRCATVTTPGADRYSDTRMRSEMDLRVRRGLLAPMDEAYFFTTPSCLTANCTWSSIETLAICADMRSTYARKSSLVLADGELTTVITYHRCDRKFNGHKIRERASVACSLLDACF
jgi:hypothetical protein